MTDNSSPVPQWLCDADSTCVIEANDAAVAFWGYDRETLIGMPSIEMLCEEELPKVYRLKSLNQWGETGPWKCRRADGTCFVLTVRWHQVSHEGRLCDFVLATRAGESVDSLEAIDERWDSRIQSSR